MKIKSLTDVENSSPRLIRLTEGGLFIIMALIVLLCVWKEQFLLLALLGVLGLLALPFATPLVLVYYGAVLALRTPMNFLPVTLAGFRFYGGDLFLCFVAAAFLYDFRNGLWGKPSELTPRNNTEKWLYLLLVIWMGWGAFSAVNGWIGSHLPLRDVLGDYRRLYIYVLAFLAPLGLPLYWKHLRGLTWVFIAGGGGVILFGLFRVATGHYFHATLEHDEFPRLLSDDEIVSLAIALAYMTALALFEKGSWKRGAAMAFGTLCAAFMMMSGWRMGFLHMLLAPGLVFFLMSRMRHLPFGRIFINLVLAGFIAVSGLVVGAVVFKETSHRIWKKMEDRMDRQGAPIVGGKDMRYFAYKEALTRFVHHPVLGTGLGDELTYPKMGSDGAFIYVSGTTHNIFLDVLYQTGPFGLLIFLMFHGILCRCALRAIRRAPPEQQPFVVTLFTGYICTMVHYCYEPTGVSGMISVYFLSGLILRFNRLGQAIALETETPMIESSSHEQ